MASVPFVLEGTLASRPAASTVSGRWYFATDDNGGTLYKSNGTSWVQLAANVSAGGATGLAVKDNGSVVGTRAGINFHEGTGIDLTIADDSANNEVDVTIAATGGGGGGTDGWIDDTAVTWTYASATTFTVSGDLTAKYTKGTRLKCTNSGTKYFVVVTSSHASGTTTVTITGGSDYSLANATISANYYSYTLNPQGYPGYFNYAPAPTGFTGAVTVTTARFAVNGLTCHVILDFTGTSNATSMTFTLPVSSPRTQYITGKIINSGASAVGAHFCGSGNTTFTTAASITGGTFTASGTKGYRDQFSYEIG